MAREHYSAGEAARALGISLDTLRRWDRAGRIRVERDGANRRIVPAAEVERLAGGDSVGVSARNRLRGVIREVQVEGLMAQVEVEVGGAGRVVALITSESARSLGLRPGLRVTAVIKATSVMIDR